MPHTASPEGPTTQKSLLFQWFLKVFGVLAFSASRRSETAQEAPRRPPKTAPTGKINWFFDCFWRFFGFSAFRLPETPRRPKGPPKSPQDGPRGPQDGP